MPSMSAVAEAEPAPLAVRRAPRPIPVSARTSCRRRCGTCGSGRLRIAVEIVITLTRQAEKATTSSVSSPPIAKATKRLRNVTAYCTWSPASSSAAPNALAIPSTIAYATSAPRIAPTAAAITSYAAPSNVNIWTRCPRRVPTARAIPSSPRRSVASMTKIKKMSRIPALIEKVPKVVNSDMNALPALSAMSIASAFTVEVSRPSGVTTGFSVRTTASERATAASPLPRFETAIPFTRPGLP